MRHGGARAKARKLIKKSPLATSLARAIARPFRSAPSNPEPVYRYHRRDLDNPGSAEQYPREVLQVLNLLEYAKTSGSEYNAKRWPAGYHSVCLGETFLRGQRQPKDRIAIVPFDFKDKTVLDIGCNAGGMLFAVADQIRQGTGIDYDSRMINAANRIRTHNNSANLSFYVFDLQKEDLNLMQDLVPVPKVDIAFLLSVCRWLQNWKQVIDMTARLSTKLLFESNGSEAQQGEQAAYLRQLYKNVQLLSDKSVDDPTLLDRRLYLCE